MLMHAMGIQSFSQTFKLVNYSLIDDDGGGNGDDTTADD
jgi:hypothetical protein